MSPFLRSVSRLAAGSLLVLALGSRQAAADDPLSVANPFMPPASAGGGPAAKPTADTPIELRGIMQAGDATMFSIYDPSRKTSTWVKLGETGRDFIVRRYDDKSDTVNVDYQGRTVTLALRTAKVASSGNSVPVAAPPPPTVGNPVVLNPSPADEQRRLEAIAAEVNRRRQLRQQAIRQQMLQHQPQQK
jgi:hypothetical protein